MNICKCGCGQEVNNQYAHGHNSKGRKVLESTKLKHRLLMLGNNNPMKNPDSRDKMIKRVTGKPKRKPLLKQFRCEICGIPFEASGHSRRKFCDTCGNETNSHKRQRGTEKYKLRVHRWLRTPNGRASSAKSGISRRQHSTNPQAYANRIRQLHQSKELCNVCGCEYKENHEIDHIIPLFKGGTDIWNNLQPICYECHKKKTAINNQRGN